MIRAWFPSLLATAALTGGLLAGSPAVAAGGFKTEQLRILPAASLVAEPSRGFHYGDHLRLTVKPGAQSQAATGFEVRIFRLEPDGTVRPWAVVDPCYVYLSGTYSDVRAAKDVLDFGPLDTLAWLSLSKGAQPEPGYFLMVFETRTQDGSIIRVEPEVMAAYLKHGLRVRVDPAPSSYSQADVDRAVADGLAKRDGLASQIYANTPAYSCYQLKPGASASADETLQLCEANLPVAAVLAPYDGLY